MKKRIIADIRLYKSDSKNDFGGYNTISFADKKLNAIVQRVVMKLRENGFSLGEFDHLYINFTTCDTAESMMLSDKVDRYFPWYRDCVVRVERDFYQKLGSTEANDGVVHRIRTVLVAFFSTEDFDGSRIRSCVQQAVEQGEEMLMKFKEKVSTKRKAVVFLRYLDTCRFYPLLRVYDAEDTLLFEKDLPETLTLDCMGDIQLTTKRVTIKPRKNAFTAQSTAMVFEY